jgi:hypothetical protein
VLRYTSNILRPPADCQSIAGSRNSKQLRPAYDGQARRYRLRWMARRHNGGDVGPVSRLERRSSCVVIQWRLTSLVGHLLLDLGNLCAHLEHTRSMARRVARSLRRAPCRIDAIKTVPAMPLLPHLPVRT